MINKRKLIIGLDIFVAVVAVAGMTFLFATNAKDTYQVNFDTKGGTYVAPITVTEGDTINEPKTELAGYYVEQWEHNGRKWNFELNRVRNNMTLVVDWSLNTYEIEYELNGGIMPESFPTSYTIESDIELSIPTKEGAVFAGWFDKEDGLVEKIIPGMIGDLQLTATWIENLILKSSDRSKGDVGVYATNYEARYVTVYNIPKDNKYHIFKGWYDKNDALLSTEYKYTFKIENNDDIYITAKYMSEQEENEWNLNHGVIPKVVSDNEYLLYGMYPQSNVNDPELIENIKRFGQTPFNNYYYFDHEYYYFSLANLYRNSDGEFLACRDFDNGETIIDGDIYCFKVEPIKWRIASIENNKYTVLCDNALNTSNFCTTLSNRIIDDEIVYPNNYKYSSIREWLNDDFYGQIFCFNDKFVVDTFVDNSAQTTLFPEKLPDCGNTEDKIFLLSYKDYIDSRYGFSPNQFDNARMIKTTDFCRIRRCAYGVDDNNLYVSALYTRSAHYDESGKMQGVTKANIRGMLNSTGVYDGTVSFQPAMNIILDF